MRVLVGMSIRLLGLLAVLGIRLLGLLAQLKMAAGERGLQKHLAAPWAAYGLASVVMGISYIIGGVWR